MVSASPQADWLVLIDKVKKAKISAINAPAKPPIRSALATLASYWLAKANPAIAPTSIMPSTPKLITPVRSATSSPKPAKIIGVAAATVPARIAVNSILI